MSASSDDPPRPGPSTLRAGGDDGVPQPPAAAATAAPIVSKYPMPAMTLDERALNEALASGRIDTATLAIHVKRQPNPTATKRSRFFRFRGNQPQRRQQPWQPRQQETKPNQPDHPSDRPPSEADAEAEVPPETVTLGYLADTANAEARRRRRLEKQARPPPPLPRTAQRIATKLGLLQEEDHEERIVLFLGYCRLVNYSYNTAMQYFKALRAHEVFGPRKGVVRTKAPDKVVFANAGRVHRRIVSMADFATFFNYLWANPSHSSAPLLIAALTGLRTMEVLQFSLYTLAQLRATMPVVSSIRRKQTVVPTEESIARGKDPINYWRPVYTSQLVQLCNWLRAGLFADEFAAYVRHGIDMKLFPFYPSTLAYRVNAYYQLAVGNPPPHGFGIHSFRNMQAMVMARNRASLQTIQHFLQHVDPNTTRRYIKADFSETAAEFDRLTKLRYATINRNLTLATATADEAAEPAGVNSAPR